MLKLDVSKVRKGTAIGLPYQGSKKKISKKIVEIIKQNFGKDKPIYDIFGGGGAITAECLLNGLDVHYNDLDFTITTMFQKIINEDREYLKTLIISRNEFIEILNKEFKTIDDELKLLVNSFAYNRKSYLYSKDVSDIKYNIAMEIIENHDTFSNYRKTETYIKNLQKFKDKSYQKTRLQQLERIDKLQNMQSVPLHIEPTNLDYNAFSNVKNAILYLDPPYENTTLEGYTINEFNSQLFYDWAYNMSKNNIVLVSSYSISDNRFSCVYEFKKARSTFSGSYGDRTEKLFMAKQ